jgi:hypothetical protein
MKKVRFLAGVVGLAPAVVAAVPATAQAATAGVAGKTVRMHSAVLRSGCTADHEWSVKSIDPMGRTNQKLWFWTRDLGAKMCVGTVEDSTAVYGATSNHQLRLRIYASDGGGFVRKLNHVYGATETGNHLLADIGVHSSWTATKIEVCAAWVKNSDSDSVTIGPVCKIATS